MRDDTLAMPLLDEQPRPDPAEPQFDWRFASHPRDPIAAAERDRRKPAAQSSVPVGSLLYLALVGLVAVAIIGVFYGTGFRLLAPPKETVAASKSADPTPPSSHGDILRARSEVSPVPPKSAMPNPAAVATLPTASEAPRAATADTPSQQDVPTAAVNNPPSQIALAPAGQRSSSASSAPRTLLANQPETPKSEAGLSAGGKHHSSHSRRGQHTRSALPHPHAQSGQSLTAPTASETRSFDELVTQLTGQARSDVPSLTPPRAQQPDPFATQRPIQ